MTSDAELVLPPECQCVLYRAIIKLTNNEQVFTRDDRQHMAHQLFDLIQCADYIARGKRNDR
jgi:hypothetical protein